MVFMISILALVWTLQLAFVDDIYTLNKISEIRTTADTIEANLEHEDLDALVSRLSFNSSSSIRVFSTTTGEIISSADSAMSSLISLSSTSLMDKYYLAVADGGEYISTNVFSGVLGDDYDELAFEGLTPSGDDDTASSILYVRAITLESGAQYCVLIEGVITPFTSSTNSSLIVLGIASGSILIFILIIAFVLGKSIVEPIKYVTASATEIKNGNYNIDFKGDGYKEIDDLNDALRKASTELSSVEKYRQELVANVSHDLRTPLSLIKGYCELMSDIPTERTPENLDIISEEVDRLSALVADMLDLSRTQEEMSKLQLTNFNIVASVAAIAKRLKHMLVARNLNVQFNTDDAILMVYADEMKISQVIYNLLSNAINYVGADNLVEVNITKRRGNVRVEVTDHGDGIDVAILPNIWDRYYKSDRNHIRSHIGTGLGLSIVKTVMAKHEGGQYGVLTKKGEGSTFYIELPLFEVVRNN